MGLYNVPCGWASERCRLAQRLCTNCVTITCADLKAYKTQQARCHTLQGQKKANKTIIAGEKLRFLHSCLSKQIVQKPCEAERRTKVRKKESWSISTMQTKADSSFWTSISKQVTWSLRNSQTSSFLVEFPVYEQDISKLVRKYDFFNEFWVSKCFTAW